MLETVLKYALPKSVQELRWKIFRLAEERVEKRLNTKTDRLDFMHYVKRHNDEKGMSRGEIDSTFTSLVVAGMGSRSPSVF